MKKRITVIDENGKEFTYSLFVWKLAWFISGLIGVIFGYLMAKL